MWRQGQVRQFKVVCSDLVVLETLVKPFREHDAVVEAVFRSLFESSEVMLHPTTRSLWEETAWPRADTDLKTPDALHAAAAMSHECTLVVTSDGEFRRVRALSVVALDDLLDDKPTNLEVAERTIALLADCSYKNAGCQ